MISARKARVLAEKADGVPNWVWNRLEEEAMDGKAECTIKRSHLGINGVNTLIEQGYTVASKDDSITISWQRQNIVTNLWEGGKAIDQQVGEKYYWESYVAAMRQRLADSDDAKSRLAAMLRDGLARELAALDAFGDGDALAYAAKLLAAWQQIIEEVTS